MKKIPVRNDRIAVIIVNYRTAQLVIKGIQALHVEKSVFPYLHVITIDNHSPDDSVKIISQAIEKNGWSEWVKLVPAKKNGGFAYGNNLGFKEAKSWLNKIDYFWMLNPDTKVLPGATSALVSYLQQYPRTIVGSCLEDHDGTKQVSAFHFPSFISELCAGFGLGMLDRLFKPYLVHQDIPNGIQQTDWLAGASLMFTNSVQQQLGQMDETYFLYFEEVDYLLKANKLDIRCFYIPNSRVVHEVGAATGISDMRKKQPRRPQYWFESRRRYFIKNHGGWYLFLADTLWMLGYSSWCVRKWLTNRKQLRLQPPKLLRDFFLHSQWNLLVHFRQ